jgi:hypothetical protein
MTWLLLLACTGRTDTSERFDSGRRNAGSVRVDQLTLDFGSVALGESDTRALTFQNTSPSAFVDVWMDQEPDDNAFVVEMTDTFLSPGQSTQWSVTFEPSEPGEAEAGIEIWSSDTEFTQTEIRLVGQGTGAR